MRLAAIAFTTLISSALLLGQAGRRAPGFSLPDSSNQQYDLADYRGKVVILDIMRSDCPECGPFSKKLEEIKTYYKGKVAVIGITNPPDSPKLVAKFIADGGLTYPILFDCGQAAYSFVRPNPLRPSILIPHVFLIDREGIIRADFQFGTDTREIFLGSDLYKEVDKVLAAPKRRR
jgi:peroxiredoxin